jgi:hypothetical protein
VLREAFRVLRPGGAIYMKDVFTPDRALTPPERLELAEFDRVYAQRTPRLGDVVSALAEAGFEDVTMEPLTQKVDLRPFYGPMRSGPTLTPFGKAHYRAFRQLPVEFWQLAAKRGGH